MDQGPIPSFPGLQIPEEREESIAEVYLEGGIFLTIQAPTELWEIAYEFRTKIETQSVETQSEIIENIIKRNIPLKQNRKN